MEAPQLHMANPDGTPNANFEGVLGDLLTHKDQTARCFGRAVASGITQTVMDWCNAEMERGTDPGAVMLALMELQIQQLASITGNFVTAAGTDVLLKTYHDMLDAQFGRHAQAIRDMLNQSPAKPNIEQTEPAPRSV